MNVVIDNIEDVLVELERYPDRVLGGIVRATRRIETVGASEWSEWKVVVIVTTNIVCAWFAPVYVRGEKVFGFIENHPAASPTAADQKILDAATACVQRVYERCRDVKLQPLGGSFEQ